MNEFQEIPTAEVAAKLLERLQAYKESSFFTDRTDIEVAGAADASYGQLLEVIDMATRAGFTDWRFAMPQDLSARPTP